MPFTLFWGRVKGIRILTSLLEGLVFCGTPANGGFRRGFKKKTGTSAKGLTGTATW